MLQGEDTVFDLSYVIFSADETYLIDFNEVKETSLETLRYSIDGTLTFVKWNTTDGVPNFVEQLQTKSIYYTHDQMLEQLSTNVWYDLNLGPT